MKNYLQTLRLKFRYQLYWSLLVIVSISLYYLDILLTSRCRFNCETITPYIGDNFFLQPQHAGPPAIAVSLVVYKESCETVDLILSSLFNSDISKFSFVVFVWMNDETFGQSMKHIFLRYGIITVPNTSGRNAGLVIPRIKIMKEIMRHPMNFRLIVEIHSDITFPSEWIIDLLKHDGIDVGIFQPFILRQFPLRNCSQALGAVEYLSRFTQSSEFMFNCVQVHPWIIKREVIEKVGYYDPDFSPQNCEDDEFYFRVLKSGYKTVSVRSSWACHFVTMTRSISQNNLLKNIDLFFKKTGISLSNFQEKYLHKCYPAWFWRDTMPAFRWPFSVRTLEESIGIHTRSLR